MKKFAVLGNPIQQSRSPVIHAAFARQCGIQLAYEARLVPLDGLAAEQLALRESGFSGCNITTPFKAEALALADDASERAVLAGAANTWGWTAEGRLWADTTDGLGLVRDIEVNAAWPVAGREVLLLGAGGASSGCLGPLIEAKPGRIAVWNRSVDKAEALVRRHHALAQGQGVELQALTALEGGFDAVINGTSAALQQGQLALPQGLLREGGLALDMVYGAAAAPFLAWAAGAAFKRDGLGMLVEQAAESFQRWHGVRPETAPVLAMLRQPA